MPQKIVVDGSDYLLESTLKHDSWAATVIYAGNGKRVVCKFNRQQSLFGFPMKWVGNRLADRENWMYRELSDLEQIPKGDLDVLIDGKTPRHLAAHEFIEGHPLRWHDTVDDQFFVRLLDLIEELHRRNIAYVDLNKSENIIKKSNGAPCLIDFQISFWLPRQGLFSIVPLRWIANRWLRVLQRCDLYHLGKLVYRFRPDQSDHPRLKPLMKKPVWIRIHRSFAAPFRRMRRKLLVLMRIRKGSGKPHSELFIEETHRQGTGLAKPISKLYTLLVSSEYQAHCPNDFQAIRNQIETDLIGHPMKPGRNGRTTSIHDLVVDILRSQAVYQASDNWSDQWAEERIEAIRNNLECQAMRKSA